MAYNKDEQDHTAAVLFHRGKTLMASWGNAKDALVGLVKHYKLLVFDFDRTLVPFNKVAVYAEVGHFIDYLWDNQFDNIKNRRLNLAILSNQGGVVFREKTNDSKYPTLKQALERLETGAIQAGVPQGRIYVAWGINYKKKWEIPESMRPGDTGTTPEERKPGGALLRKIMEDFGVEPCDTLMVGDSLTDIGAAQSVGADGLLVKMERY